LTAAKRPQESGKPAAEALVRDLYLLFMNYASGVEIEAMKAE